MNKNNSTHKKIQSRIIIVGIVFFCFFLVISYRSYELQALGNAKLHNLATSQYIKKLIVRPKRGTIYDRHGNVLAIDIEVASVGIHPHKIQNKKKVIKYLSKHTKIAKKDLLKKIQSKKRFEWIQRRIPKEDGDALKSLKDKGILVETEYRRYYPNKVLAANVLGAVGYDAKALGGIELTYDKYLRTQTVKAKARRDAKGRLLTPMYISDSNHDVYLTIDKNIQQIAETALKKNAIHHKVKSGFAIVMDAKTGEVLALANYPHFDPNRYWKYPMSEWKNHAVIDTFEPGSTFKTMLIAAALQSGKVKPTDEFFCENGSYRIGKYIINDHGGYGRIDVRKILKVSSNIGVTKIAEKIGAKYFSDFIKEMGFGKKTELNFIGELSGVVRNYKSWKRIGLSNVAFGQGLTVNALQMVKAYSAIVNGGNLMQPFLVTKVTDAKGRIVKKNEKKVIKQVIQPEVSEELKKVLFLVTQLGGTARRAHVEGYLAGGKTGTAQKVNPKTRRYQHGAYVSSFIGFSPVKNPELLIYVVYDTPSRNGYYGGIVAGPVFQEIAEKSLAYLTVPIEDNSEYWAFYEHVNQIKHHVKNNSNKTLKKNGQDEDEMLSSDELTRLRNIQLYKIHKDIESKIVPDFRGLTFRKVIQIEKKYGLKIQFKGNGIVTDQLPKPGEKFKEDEQLEISLSRRI